MGFPTNRPRRLRKNEMIRDMVTETRLHVSDFIMPLFVCPGQNVKNPVASMPGMYQFSLDNIVEECKIIRDLGVNSILLFGIPERKDEDGAVAAQEDGIVQQAIRKIKTSIDNIYVITDVCNCEYTTHGHCGTLVNGDVDNDKTLETLAKQAVSHARAGADMIAPSDMMDGRVKRIRETLDDNGFTDIPIMSYAAKFTSAFYGPFRDAVESTPQFGDRSSYQMNPANINEAIKEVALDIEEGADIVMVKPALSYLDVIKSVKDQFNIPVAAYNVSGEYSMIKAAAEKKWINEESMVKEILTSIKRAGADLIISYFTKYFAEILK